MCNVTNKPKDTKKWLYDNRTMLVREMIKALNLKLVGHYRYYGITFNGKMIANFLHRVQQFLCKTLNRRSDKKSYSWDGYRNAKILSFSKAKDIF